MMLVAMFMLMRMSMAAVAMIAIAVFVGVFISVRVFVMMLAVAVAMAARLSMFVGVRMRMSVGVGMRFFAVPVAAVVLFVFVLLVGMRGPLVDAEFDPLDGLAFLPLEVHVEVADLQFGEFPLQGGRFDPKVAKSADGHVAADAREAVEKENAHKVV